MRIANRVLSLVLASVIAAGGIVVAVEIALAGLGDSKWLLPWPDWYRWVLDHDWTSTAVALTCWGLAAAGLILLVFAFALYRPVTLEAVPYSADVVSSVRRVPLERSLERTARRIDGIAAVAVKVSRHSVRIKARSNRRDVGGLRDEVAQSVAARLDLLHLVPSPQVRVHVAARRR